MERRNLAIISAVYVLMINILVNSVYTGKLTFYNASASILDGNHITPGMNPICNLGLLTNYLLMVVFIVQSQLSNENMFKYRKLFSAIIILYLVFQVSMNSLVNSAIVKHTANFMIKQTNATMAQIPACEPCSNEISYFRPDLRVGLAEYMIPVYIMQFKLLSDLEEGTLDY